MKHFAAVIFDMDGLLLDTERVALVAFEEACRRLDLVLPGEVFVRCLGGNKEASRRILEEALRGVAEVDAFRGAWDEAYLARVAREPVGVKEGAMRLLEHIGSLGVPAAVATSTTTSRARAKLETAGLLPHFTQVVGGDQVTRSKPDPAIYLRAAQVLQVDPGECLALEDSENGVRAAVAAGMCVVQIPDLVPPSPELLRLGHIVLPSLTCVSTYPFASRGQLPPGDSSVSIALERADQEEVIRLIDALDAYQKPLYPPESFHGIDMAALLQPGVLFAVAREAGQAVGCGAVVLGPEHGEIKRMYVLPGVRGRGIGARLLAFVETAAEREGCRRFVLETGIHQGEALALYERAGYVRCPPFDDYLPDPMSVFMEKRRP
jgi:putative acetyltransferase